MCAPVGGWVLADVFSPSPDSNLLVVLLLERLVPQPQHLAQGVLAEPLPGNIGREKKRDSFAHEVSSHLPCQLQRALAARSHTNTEWGGGGGGSYSGCLLLVSKIIKRYADEGRAHARGQGGAQLPKTNTHLYSWRHSPPFKALSGTSHPPPPPVPPKLKSRLTSACHSHVLPHSSEKKLEVWAIRHTCGETHTHRERGFASSIGLRGHRYGGGNDVWCARGSWQAT